MPEHEISTEAQWLAGVYAELGDFDGQWIAVVGTQIVGNDPDVTALTERVSSQYGAGRALFASVVFDRLG